VRAQHISRAKGAERTLLRVRSVHSPRQSQPRHRVFICFNPGRGPYSPPLLYRSIRSLSLLRCALLPCLSSPQPPSSTAAHPFTFFSLPFISFESPLLSFSPFLGSFSPSLALSLPHFPPPKPSRRARQSQETNGCALQRPELEERPFAQALVTCVPGVSASAPSPATLFSASCLI
jgi:hypothetical protein